jgi:hypothetical protein
MIGTVEIEPCAALIPASIGDFAGSRCSCPSWASPERSTGIYNIQSTDPARLVEVAGLWNACDLDLLLFFARHPRVVLTSEQLAAYVGYDLVEVARALDRLLGAGRLKRALNHGAPGRMYVLEVDHAEEWLESLRRVCATPEGRNAVKAVLRERRSQTDLPTGDPGRRRLSGTRPIVMLDSRR